MWQNLTGTAEHAMLCSYLMSWYYNGNNLILGKRFSSVLPNGDKIEMDKLLVVRFAWLGNVHNTVNGNIYCHWEESFVPFLGQVMTHTYERKYNLLTLSKLIMLLSNAPTQHDLHIWSQPGDLLKNIWKTRACVTLALCDTGSSFRPPLHHTFTHSFKVILTGN